MFLRSFFTFTLLFAFASANDIINPGVKTVAGHTAKGVAIGAGTGLAVGAATIGGTALMGGAGVVGAGTAIGSAGLAGAAGTTVAAATGGLATAGGVVGGLAVLPVAAAVGATVGITYGIHRAVHKGYLNKNRDEGIKKWKELYAALLAKQKAQTL